ncbi:cocaine esterase [Luminiphilus syltensis NOR5-1B]|uniref:Cocaine esterase n=1 Tax=Luminiphilus syltensis NOR5-1B TaxID=565045 RepID=B8KY35_9GAMM|nr:CocE/NonD family hydrolase [Luminiphilus syltensis]EED34220.1 cocaine esterase [Luminiphilus syltensis NOR5-1B]
MSLRFPGARYLSVVLLSSLFLSPSTVFASAEGLDEPQTVPFAKGPYEVRVERSHFIPMRDGVRLSTDLYFPEGHEGKLPVIMERTPYDKAARRSANPDDPISSANQAYYFASHGYAVAVQDRRGKFESEGDYVVLNNDVEDAADTLDWFEEQDWFSGSASMIGCSIPGANTIKAAQTLHPALKSIVPQSAATGHGTAGGTMAKFWIRGGVQNLTIPLWTHYLGSKLFFRPPHKLNRDDYLAIRDFFEPAPDVGSMAELFDEQGNVSKQWKDALMHLPVVEIDDVLDSPPTDWDNLATRGPLDPWWDGGDYLEDDTTVDGAALHINSWHDYGVNETFLQYQHFKNRAESTWARNNQFVIVSPLSHCNAETVTSAAVSGDRELGDARFDFWGTYLKWFDYTLKGLDNGFSDMPAIQYYLPGANEWRAANEWPLPGTQRTKVYLSSDGSANTRLGDGRLAFEPPKAESRDIYTYDPADPVYTGLKAVQQGAYEASALETREDVLVYTSEPLDDALEITGSLRAKIWLSTDVTDTDLAVRLLDVFPNGKAYPIQEGYLRLRYREGFDREVMMEPGELYPIDLDMLVAANRFNVGHRIRIEVTSSNFPSYGRNLNTGGDNARDSEYRPARVTIFHGPEAASYVELPVIPQPRTTVQTH